MLVDKQKKTEARRMIIFNQLIMHNKLQ